jgi:hypothetical protein
MLEPSRDFELPMDCNPGLIRERDLFIDYLERAAIQHGV